MSRFSECSRDKSYRREPARAHGRGHGGAGTALGGDITRSNSRSNDYGEGRKGTSIVIATELNLACPDRAFSNGQAYVGERGSALPARLRKKCCVSGLLWPTSLYTSPVTLFKSMAYDEVVWRHRTVPSAVHAPKSLGARGSGRRAEKLGKRCV